MHTEIESWLEQINHSLPSFVDTLGKPDQVGRYYPCLDGVTAMGKQISLGFSTFAARIYYMLNRLDEFPEDQRNVWADYLRSFQTRDCSAWHCGENDYGFIDRPQVDYLLARESEKPILPKTPRAIARRLINLVYNFNMPSPPFPPLKSTIMAETRQALITLSLMGEQPEMPYRGFPLDEDGVIRFLQLQDWSRPWGAGAHAAVLAVFVVSQSPLILDDPQFVKTLKDTIAQFLDGIVDSETGCYFIGRRPDYTELVNGCHKVLTALEWLDVKIHYPERIIDTILAKTPFSEGCHLVDAVYPLYRCSLQVDYRRDDIREYGLQLVDMIRRHYNDDGGFSYYIGRSQTKYYGIEISAGLNESDLHGSLLLTWALTMLVQILDINICGWKTFRP